MGEFIAIFHWTPEQYFALTLAERDHIIAAHNRLNSK